MYFLNEGAMKQQIGKGHIIKKIDLVSLGEEIDNIKETLNQLTVQYKVYNLTDSWMEVQKLEGDLKKLYRTAGFSEGKAKRGLANFIGSGLKALFGTMSDDDAKEIHTKIQIINDNEAELSAQMKGTVGVISELNESSKRLKLNQLETKKKIDEITTTLNKLITNLQKDHEKIGVLKTKYIIWIEHLAWEIATIHYAILFLKTGVIDPFLLNEDEIISAATKMDLGYVMKGGDLERIWKNHPIKVIADERNKCIFIVMEVPRTEAYEMTVYKLIPIVRNEKAIKARKYFISVNDTEYWVNNVLERTYIGGLWIGRANLLHLKKENSSCEANLFYYKRDDLCEYELRKDEVTEILTNKGFLITYPREAALNYNCGGQDGILMIKGTFLLKTNGTCRVWNEDFLINKQLTPVTTTLSDYISVIYRGKGHEQEEEDQVNLINPMTELKEINNIDYKLQVLHDKIDTFHLQKYHIIGISTGIPTIIGVIVIIGLILYRVVGSCKLDKILNK